MYDRYSWLLRFTRRDLQPTEEIYFQAEETARDALQLYNDPENGELYTMIVLLQIDWPQRSECQLDEILFC